jgi:hypothetical protein
MFGILAGLGCQRGPTQTGNTPGPTVGTPAPAAPAPPLPRLLTGSFDAISTTATGITGDLTLTVTTLTFSQGLTYETTPAASVQASGLFAKNAGTWANLLAVDTGSTIEVRAVESEAVGAQATNGGLCAPDKTTFIALTSVSGSTDSPVLKMAAFKSTVVPGAEADENDLCGTFTYASRGQASTINK